MLIRAKALTDESFEMRLASAQANFKPCAVARDPDEAGLVFGDSLAEPFVGEKASTSTFVCALPMANPMILSLRCASYDNI